MTDDIVTRLRDRAKKRIEAIEKYWRGHKFEYEIPTLEDQAADEIERLRTTNTELVKMFKQVGIVAEIWQKTEDELIELHHGKCAEQFAEQVNEIERLRAEIERLTNKGHGNV